MAGYYSFPTISRTNLAFVCEDDLWIAPREGGAARRLTTGLNQITWPRFSPDGKQIAFTSNAEGSFQVYIVPVEGGVPTRLTYDGSLSGVVTFRPNGKLVFRSWRDSAVRNQPRLYEISLDGTGLTALPVGYGVHLDVDSDDDHVVIGWNGIDSAQWKRYRGGLTGDMWIGSIAKQSFRRLVKTEGNPVLPVFVGSRVYFISDADGFGNVWSCRKDGRDLQQHTHHRDYYVRHLRALGKELVYKKGADLWRLDAKSGESKRIKLETSSSGIQLRRRFVDPEPHLHEISLAPDGRRISAIVRGKSLTLSAWDGPVHALGERSGVRYRNPIWLSGGKELVVISDEGGEEVPEVYDAETGERKERVKLADAGRITKLYPNPARRVFAATDVAGRLIVVDLDRKDGESLVASSETGAIRQVAWSLDGRWLAYVTPIDWIIDGGVLHLLDTKTEKTAVLNDEELTVHSPAFDPGGEFLYVLSERSFNPVLDAVHFAASIPVSTRIYAYVLSKDGLSPFDGRWAVRKEEEKKAGKGDSDSGAKTGKETKSKTAIDLPGLSDRLVEFPHIPSGVYSSLQTAPNKVLYLEHPPRGMLEEDSNGESADNLPSLFCYDLMTGVRKRILPGVRAYEVHGEKTLTWSPSELRILRTGEEPPKEPSQPGKNRFSGIVDMQRLRVEVVPGDEWRQMLVEAWRLQRDHFWTETMSEIDWKEVLDRYLPLVDRIATRFEFSDLVWELQGELGTSHAYEFGGDHPPVQSYAVGLLGADLRWDGEGYRVERVFDGDTWCAGAGSPLTAPGVRVKKGDRILAVNGRTLDERVRPEAALVHEAGSEAELLIQSLGRKKKQRVVVKTLVSEAALRYRDWVKSNRDYVAKRSKGKLGYVHLPDMMGEGLAEFFRSFRTESKKPGLVVDARANGGGFVSNIILEYLRRRVIGFEFPRYGQPVSYPPDAVQGPMVALCDQYTGSDGDMFSYAFRKYGLGPLIGKRTWGGVVGIDINTHLADGTLVTQPEYAACFHEVGWGIENHGVDPDIEVENDPASVAAGKDPQLDCAIEVALETLAKAPVKEPVPPPIPSLRVKR